MSTRTTLAPRWSVAGIAIGAIALLLAVTHFWAGPFDTPPPLEQTVAEKAVALRDAAVAALRGQDYEAPTARSAWNVDRVAQLAVAVLAALAIIAAVGGFARGESGHAAGGALLLGATALAFQFAIAVLGALLVVFLIGVVLSQLDIGCCCCG